MSDASLRLVYNESMASLTTVEVLDEQLAEGIVQMVFARSTKESHALLSQAPARAAVLTWAWGELCWISDLDRSQDPADHEKLRWELDAALQTEPRYIDAIAFACRTAGIDTSGMFTDRSRYAWDLVQCARRDRGGCLRAASEQAHAEFRALQPLGREPLAPTALEEPSGYCFRKSGELWELRFGEESGLVKDSVGMSRIALLLRHRGEPVSSLILARRFATSVGDPLLDGVAIKDLEREESELQSKLAETDDPAERAEIGEQLGLIESQRTSAVGLGGRLRRQGDDYSRASSSCGMSIGRAIQAIKRQGLGRLAAHLEANITGPSSRAPVYDLKESVDWELD